MTIRRWIADQFDANTATLAGANARHLAVVLRARIGEEFAIVCGGQLRRGRVTSASPNKVEFALLEEIPSARGHDITLLLSIFKFDRMEWALEKVTELGVTRIVPVIAHRTDTHLAAAAKKRVERWRRLTREATQQSRRDVPPIIEEAVALAFAISHCPVARRFVLAESKPHQPLAQLLYSGGSPVALAVGPEGGWTDSESRLFAEHGWVPAGLGANILRAETAAMVAVALVACHSET